MSTKSVVLLGLLLLAACKPEPVPELALGSEPAAEVQPALTLGDTLGEARRLIGRFERIEEGHGRTRFYVLYGIFARGAQIDTVEMFRGSTPILVVPELGAAL